MKTRSIGVRLTLWYAAILTAGLGLFGFLVWFSLRHELLNELDADLHGRAARFETYFQVQFAQEPPRRVVAELIEFCQALPPPSFIRLKGDRGFVFNYPRSPNATNARIVTSDFTVDGQNFHLEVGGPVTSVDHTLSLLRLLLLGLVPLVIAFACTCGAWLSHRALKPVQDIADAALTIDNAGGRLPVPATGDELAYLTTVLNTMLERLDAAVSTLSQFVADASHELRTPLAILLADAELALRRARSPESYRQSLEQVVDQGTRMTRLVEDLLFLARSDGHLVQMPLEPVPLSGIVRDVHAAILPLAEAYGIGLKLAVGTHAAVVSANPDALRRLLLALLDNALKYSPAGAEVNVRVDNLEISVQDSGIGIGAQDLPFIFDRFYRADRSRSSGGHGLGLSLARSIARAHGAEIEVSSVEGQGSVFRVVFAAKCQPQEIFS
jgi:signal transduction histidine kinase